MLTWAPNQDITQPGILYDIQNAIPTAAGYRKASDPVVRADLNPQTLLTGSGLIRGYSFLDRGGKTVGLVSTRGRIYDWGTSMPIAIGFTSPDPFSFACLDDKVYASNVDDGLYQSPRDFASLAFTAVPGTVPKFRKIVAVGKQLLGFGTTANITYNSNTYTADDSRWWASQIGVSTNFSPSLATGAETDVLNDANGTIVDAIEFRGSVVVFKRTAIYIGTRQEGIGWVWTQVNSEFGSICDVVKNNNVIYFMSPTNGGEMCSFDGSTVRQLSYAQLGSQNFFTQLGPATVAGANDVGFASTGALFTMGQKSMASVGNFVYALTNYEDLSFRYAQALVLDINTGRFGQIKYISAKTGPALSSPHPLFIWSGAENRSIGCVAWTSARQDAPGSINPFVQGSVNGASYSKFRQFNNGQERVTSAAQAYYTRSIPSNGALTVVGSRPPLNDSRIASANASGKFSFAQVSGSRFDFNLVVDQDHELIELEVYFADPATNQAKPANIIT